MSTEITVTVLWLFTLLCIVKAVEERNLQLGIASWIACSGTMAHLMYLVWN